MRIEPNRMFVMPARHQMTLDRDIFHLRTTPGPADWRMTINIFLSSLAEAKGRCAVAAVLSDMDVDGCAALENIKGAGGVTFAQSDASYDSMPRHAMATGHVDFPLPAADIARSLLKLGR
jgi:two-component system CheB/CheR fusion protein